jgi:hypothetical protein
MFSSREEVVEIAPEDLDVESCTADALSKQEAVYGNVKSCSIRQTSA